MSAASIQSIESASADSSIAAGVGGRRSTALRVSAIRRIVTPTAGQDPNPLAYNRFLKVNGVGGRRVTLDISWGRNLSLMPSVDASWTCSQSSGIRRATCSTDKYKKPLDSEWNAWLPGSGSDNAVTVNARAGGRVDTDTALITLTTPRR